jgi:arsenite/tail-anchored protein-transporting ATPase
VRILFYTGKGGVGKTSVAAATAIRCAELGYRTVVLSTDLAHSLGDSLDVHLGPEPGEVAPNLWAQETDIYYNLRHQWGVVQEWLNALLLWQGGFDSLLADELTVLPGMDELANLLWINRHRESGKYDVVVVDAAPTGETLRLLSIPDVVRWWVEHIFPVQRRAMGVARPLLRAITDMPMPTDKVYDSIEALFDQLDRLHGMLIDPKLTSVRLVLNPEKMVVAEAERTHTYFHLFGYPSDLVVANRVLPADVSDPYFDAWKDTQALYMQQIEEGFAPLPIRSVPLFRDQVVGLDALRRMGHVLYGDEDPTRIYFEGRTQVIESQPEGGYRMILSLPHVQKGEVTLRQLGDELFATVGTFRRHIILPRALIGAEVQSARFDDEHHTLTIRFAPRPGAVSRRPGR